MTAVGVGRARKAFRLPILRKDLTELAARRRTYIARFAYALVLFVTACTLFYGNIGLTAGASETLGRGHAHFMGLLFFQLAALYLIVPVLTASAITAEKERETLALLLVTTLSPRQIVLQKYASRMTPILSFVFLSFPLMAITYTFGGVTITDLVLGIVLLIYMCLELGAFAILCSAIFRTTVEALCATYLGFPILALAFPGVCSSQFMASASIGSGHPPAVSPEVTLGLVTLASTGYATFFLVACLSLAESVLVNRAFVPYRSLLLQFFRWVDRRYEKMNVLTGGIVLMRDRDLLPKRHPVRWRETQKKSLGTFRYLFRVFVALEVPVLIAIQWIRGTSPLDDSTMTGLLFVIWTATTLLISIYAASVISEERSRQTLAVLAACPLSTQQILREKLAGLRRMIAVLVVPFVTIFLFEHWWYGHSPWGYLLISLLTVAAYFPVIEWVGLAAGLRMQRQLPAMIVTLGFLIAWAGGLAVAVPLCQYFDIPTGRWGTVVSALSPLDMIATVQESAPGRNFASEEPMPWQRTPLAMAAHFAFYFGCYFLLRWRCLRTADRQIGRIPQPARNSKQRMKVADPPVAG
jgi:ABC-type transport system involved in multi-copper enzyme maturation permease subunit